VLDRISDTIRRIGPRPPTSQVGNDVPGAISPDEGAWRQAIRELASFKRPSASEGERQAAEWIAARLGALGCDAVIEQERAHGGYWWPIGLANLLALGGALLLAPRRGGKARRLGATLASGIAAAALWDDLGHGRRWFRRALLPKRATWNVIGEAGDRRADRTVVFVAHHDAAHSGLIFHPALGRFAPRFLPRLHERSSQTLPVLYGVWLGPVLICLGALGAGRSLVKAGSALALGAIVAMADIAGREVVPGANDNLAAVGVLLAIAERLRADPRQGVRVLLLSTGSEESFSEGMQAFGERHFDELDPRTTEFICLECLGGPTLIVLEGEGMLRMRAYPSKMRDALAKAAAGAGVNIMRGIKTVGACDALIALRAGYPVATLASVDYTKLPINYHWPSDTPDALHWETIEDAIGACERFLAEPAFA
jgi:acetylornithine deacetylase/succinyl-diaminopimelate desuccinylase-like protein